MALLKSNSTFLFSSLWLEPTWPRHKRLWVFRVAKEFGSLSCNLRGRFFLVGHVLTLHWVKNRSETLCNAFTSEGCRKVVPSM